jgi:hypothetical protein
MNGEKNKAEVESDEVKKGATERGEGRNMEETTFLEDLIGSWTKKKKSRPNYGTFYKSANYAVAMLI